MAWTFYSSTGEAMIQDGAMSIANNTNNRVVTATGADPASLNGEAALTFDGEHLTVSDGNLVIGTAGHGIDFSAQTGVGSGTGVTASVSELLDHYETGLFTPLLVGASAAGSITYISNKGRYTRIGDRVFIQIWLNVDAAGGSPSGQAKMTRLPFTAKDVADDTHSIAIGRAEGLSLANATESVGAVIGRNTSEIEFRVWDATGGMSDLPIGEFGTGQMSLTGFYEV